MGNKLFVGGLAWGTDENTLREAFEGFGAVREAKVILDRETGRSRGFGFVSFENEADAQSAMKSMDGANLDGRTIRVNEAEDKGGPRRSSGGPGPDVQRRGNYGGGGGGGGYGDRGGSGSPRRPSHSGGGRGRGWDDRD